jgi:hypothetical protein
VQLFLILLALCTLTTSGLMSLDEQIVGASCNGQGPHISRPGYVPNNQFPLRLAFNYNKGTYLVFSDDRTYEIAPDDRLYSAYWVTPFPPEFTDSYDEDYPILITNPYSDRSVRAKEVDTREILREEMVPTPVEPTPTPLKEPTKP